MRGKKGYIERIKTGASLLLICGLILFAVSCSDTEDQTDYSVSNIAELNENNDSGEQNGHSSEIVNFRSCDTIDHFCAGVCGEGELIAIDEDNNKYLLRLKGSSYEMGYQYGYLIGDHASHVIKGYLKKKIEVFGVLEGDILHLNIIPNKPLEINCFDLLQPHLDSVPEGFLEEIDGIVDGAVAAGHINDTETERERFRRDLYFINLGMDVTNTVVMMVNSFMSLFPQSESDVDESLAIPHSCDGFVAFGDATENGNVIMARNFMHLRDYFYEHSLLIEYNPDNGNSYVNVAAAGWTTVISGMNSKGIAVGANAIGGRNANYLTVGMGVGFLKKKVMQDAGELSEAVQIFESNKRGMPWIILLADGQGEEQGGAVIEYSANFFQVRHTDYEWNPGYIQQLFGYTEDLQIEDNPNIVALANDFITPEMNILARPFDTNPVNSRERYKAVLDQILNEDYGLYGLINMENGMDLVNYLHADLENYREGYDNYHILDNGWMPEVLEEDFVLQDESPISGSRTVFDLGNLELRTLYGMYGDPWVSYAMPR